jgi:hypothetical protein
MDAHEVGGGGCRLGVVCGGRSHRVCVYILGQPGSADLDKLDKPTNSLNEGETAAQRLPAFPGEQQGRELCVVAGRVPP